MFIIALGLDGEKELSRTGSGLAPGMGRITGSASIETLVRVGIEKEHGLSPDSKMVVLHDFTPCVDDELEVKRGQVCNDFVKISASIKFIDFVISIQKQKNLYQRFLVFKDLFIFRWIFKNLYLLTINYFY